jgi:hypothetical protein
VLDGDFLPSWQEVNPADSVRQWSTGKNVSQVGSHSRPGNFRPSWAEVLAREMVFKLDTIFFGWQRKKAADPDYAGSAVCVKCAAKLFP